MEEKELYVLLTEELNHEEKSKLTKIATYLTHRKHMWLYVGMMSGWDKVGILFLIHLSQRSLLTDPLPLVDVCIATALEVRRVHVSAIDAVDAWGELDLVSELTDSLPLFFPCGNWPNFSGTRHNPKQPCWLLSPGTLGKPQGGVCKQDEVLCSLRRGKTG